MSTCRALWAKVRELERRLESIEDDGSPTKPVEPVAVAVAVLTGPEQAAGLSDASETDAPHVFGVAAGSHGSGGRAARDCDGGKATAERAARGSLEPEPEQDRPLS